MTRPLTPRRPEPWRPRPTLPILALLVLAVALVASAGAGLRTGGADAGRRVPAAAVSHSVSISGFAYSPQTITVAAGDSITWTNQDEAPHTVTTTSGPQAINSPTLSKGQSFTFTFTAPGTYSYYCAVHPDMRAQVVVTPPVASAPPPSTTKASSASPPPTATHASTAAPHSSAAVAAGPQSTARTAAASSAHGASSPGPSSPAANSPAPASEAQKAAGSSGAPTDMVSSADSPPPADAVVPASTASGTAGTLNPALVLAGLTAGVTVFCLLLLASRRPPHEDGEP